MTQTDLFLSIEMFREFCDGQACLNRPRQFPSHHSRFLYFGKEDRDPDYEAYDDARCEVILMSGLPGAGKDTWIAGHAAEIRKSRSTRFARRQAIDRPAIKALSCKPRASRRACTFGPDKASCGTQRNSALRSAPNAWISSPPIMRRFESFTWRRIARLCCSGTAPASRRYLRPPLRACWSAGKSRTPGRPTSLSGGSTAFPLILPAAWTPGPPVQPDAPEPASRPAPPSPERSPPR
jgi:hypothetical protein